MKDNSKQRKQLIVVGGGAAGIFCAVNAARLSDALQVTVLEKTNKLLAKVKVSGGGRCNVTHACEDIREMSRSYPRGEHFVRKAFHQFFVNDTIQWFEERGVKLKTEADGRMFPVTDNSETIMHCLLQEASRYGVEFRLSQAVTDIDPAENKYLLTLASGEIIPADYVCLAAGGYPKEQQFSWLQKLGHSIEPPVASLFSFNLPGHPITGLQGISFENIRVQISDSKIQTEGPAIITHWGLSGPAVLKASAWGARILSERSWQFSAVVNWLPAYNQQRLLELFRTLKLEEPKRSVRTKNALQLPARFWEFICDQAAVRTTINWADISSKEMNSLAASLCHYRLEVKGKTTFKEEFVTAGGIKLSEIDPQSMQSKKYPGLYFAGEMMDVDGVTGGYNFQHAWTSGMLAAQSIASNLSLLLNSPGNPSG